MLTNVFVAQVKGSAAKETVVKGTGVLKNLTGLESCGWVITIDNNGVEETLEPLNFKDFKIKAEAGRKVKFSYVLSNVSTTCMAGKPVKLKSIKLQR